MTTWLVTGGARFIGSHLCEALLHRGDTVRGLAEPVPLRDGPAGVLGWPDTAIWRR